MLLVGQCNAVCVCCFNKQTVTVTFLGQTAETERYDIELLCSGRFTVQACWYTWRKYLHILVNVDTISTSKISYTWFKEANREIGILLCPAEATG